MSDDVRIKIALDDPRPMLTKVSDSLVIDLKTVKAAFLGPSSKMMGMYSLYVVVAENLVLEIAKDVEFTAKNLASMLVTGSPVPS